MTTPAGAVAADANATARDADGKKGKQGGGIFARKYGPLPGWAWALLAGGGAIAVFWWRKREEAKASSASSASSAVTGTGWANAANSLQGEISALQGQAATSKTASSTTKTATSKTTSTTVKTGTTPNKPMVVVPKVEGLRANAAIAALKAKGLNYHGSPTRNPAHEYKVVSQTPAAGKKVASGSRVDLGYQEIKK